MKTFASSLFPHSATVFFLAALLCAHTAAAGPTKVEAKAVARPKAAPKTNAPVEIQESVFVIPSNQTEGRDPFYPSSIWPYNQGSQTTKSNKTAVAVVTLVLNGIGGTVEKPLAMINGHTFEKGEEAIIPTSAGKQKVHVLEIRPESFAVVVEVNGETRLLGMRK